MMRQQRSKSIYEDSDMNFFQLMQVRQFSKELELVLKKQQLIRKGKEQLIGFMVAGI